MACNDYSNGSAPQVVFSMGTLPPGFCPDGYQALFDAIATYLAGTLPANFSTFLIRDSTPAVTDRDKLWLSVDPSNCRPLGFYLYSTTHAAWVPVAQQVWNGDAAGTANALTCTFSPTLKYLTAGHLFIVKASATANTAAATLNPSSLGAKDIKKQGGQALEGGEILPNALLLLTWRSDYFELLNPAPAAASLTPVDRIINGSFEQDSDADGLPDGWTYSGTAAGSINTSTVGHGASSFGINAAGNTTGTLVMTEMQPCKGNNTYLDGEMMVLNFWHQTSDAANDDTVSVEWFYDNGASISTATIWTWNNAAAVNTWKRMFAAMVPPTNARFFKLSINGNIGLGGSGTSYFDGMAIQTHIFKRKCEFFYTGAGSTMSYSWECPPGVTVVRIKAIGGGGGGGTTGGANGGGGGGAGGTVVATVPVVAGTRYTIAVGAGGAANANGNSSTFDATGINLIASFGTGGNSAVQGTGGAGSVGTGSSGWVFNGGDGLAGGGGVATGHGGSGSGGGGVAAATVLGTVGGAASLYGGGGGGGYGAAGGTGAAGYLSIEY
ncbi:MAG: hypothetical protein RL328_568 [Acidobacteriota bacterium]